MKTVNSKDFDWHTYSENAEKALRLKIERSENWESWVNPCIFGKIPKYTLISRRRILNNDISQKTGTSTDDLLLRITSDSLEALRKVYNSEFTQTGFDTTVPHFIVDNHEKKVVEFLSICC